MSGDIVHSLLVGVALAIAANIILVIFPVLLRKPLKLSPVEQLTISYPNSGNLVLPIVISVLGQKWAIYAMPFMLVQICFMWTHGVSSIRGGEEMNIRKILTGVNMIAFYIGLILFIFQIKLPEIIGTTVVNFSSCIAPLSMLVIGMSMGNANLKQIFSVPRHYLICFLRLIACPLIALLLFKLTGIANISEYMGSICLILLLAISSSQAATITQLAQAYHKNAQEAAMLNVMTVLFLIVTMPLNVLIYQTWVL
jgi:predicted permease